MYSDFAAKVWGRDMETWKRTSGEKSVFGENGNGVDEEDRD